AGQMEVDPRLPVLRAIDHPMREGLSEVRERRLDLVRLLLRQVAESLGPRDACQIGDCLGDPDADARDRGEGIGDRPRPIEVRVRHADDVAEIFLHALELLRPSRGFGLLLLLVLLLPAPFGPRSIEALPADRPSRFGIAHRVSATFSDLRIATAYSSYPADR